MEPSPSGTIVRHCRIERYVPYSNVSSLSRVKVAVCDNGRSQRAAVRARETERKRERK